MRKPKWSWMWRSNPHEGWQPLNDPLPYPPPSPHTEPRYYKLRRGLGTERTAEIGDSILVDLSHSYDVIGIEVLDDTTQADAFAIVLANCKWNA